MILSFDSPVEVVTWTTHVLSVFVLAWVHIRTLTLQPGTKMGRGSKSKSPRSSRRTSGGGGGYGGNHSKNGRGQQQRGRSFEPPSSKKRGLAAITPRAPPPLPDSLSMLPEFEKAKKFVGAKPGYMFTSGKTGVGYYIDRVQIGEMGDKAKARLAASVAAASAGGNASLARPTEKSSAIDGAAGMPIAKTDSAGQKRIMCKKELTTNEKKERSQVAVVPQQPAKVDTAVAAAATPVAKRKEARGAKGNGVLTQKREDGSSSDQEHQEEGGAATSESDASSEMVDEEEEEHIGGEAAATSTEKPNGVAAEKHVDVGARKREINEKGGNEEGRREEKQDEQKTEEDDGDGMEASKRAAVGLENDGGEGSVASESDESDGEEEENESQEEQEEADEGNTVPGNKPDGKRKEDQTHTSSPSKEAGQMEVEEETLDGGHEGGGQQQEKASFQSLGVTGPLCEAAGQLGWTHATEIQQQALPLAFQVAVVEKSRSTSI